MSFISDFIRRMGKSNTTGRQYGPVASSSTQSTHHRWPITAAIIGTTITIGLIITTCYAVVNVDSTEIVVVQSPISGDLTAHIDPGWKLRMFGKVTRYPRRDMFSFSAVTDQGNPVDESILTQFNDGGRAKISGVINWAMPLVPESIIRIHRDFGSMSAIEQQLIRTSLQKVIYNVGPTMSTTESSAERRPEIPQYIDDQLANGPYLTKTVRMMKPDPITNEEKMTSVVVIDKDTAGHPIRESKSQITVYGINLQPVSINHIDYDKVVQEQIIERQKSTTQVQLSIATARKAEQAAITAEQEGKAAAAKAKWDQETIKATEVTLAQQKLEVATLAAKEAEQFKKEQILRGEGEATRKRLVMEADGALDQKLAAMVDIQKVWASAIGNYNGALVPSVVMGGQSGNTPSAMSNVQDLVALATAQASKSLALDMSAAGKQATKK